MKAKCWLKMKHGALLHNYTYTHFSSNTTVPHTDTYTTTQCNHAHYKVNVLHGLLRFRLTDFSRKNAHDKTAAATTTTIAKTNDFLNFWLNVFGKSLGLEQSHEFHNLFHAALQKGQNQFRETNGSICSWHYAHCVRRMLKIINQIVSRFRCIWNSVQQKLYFYECNLYSSLFVRLLTNASARWWCSIPVN